MANIKHTDVPPAPVYPNCTIISRERVEDGTVDQHEPFIFVTERSALRWAPGFVPRALETDLGNGLQLFLSRRNGDTLYYRQDLGCITLVVYND